MARQASTKSRSFIASVEPRATRTKAGTAVIPMARIRLLMLGPSTATRMMPMMICGKLISTSFAPLIQRSTAPPK